MPHADGPIGESKESQPIRVRHAEAEGNRDRGVDRRSAARLGDQGNFTGRDPKVAAEENSQSRATGDEAGPVEWKGHPLGSPPLSRGKELPGACELIDI